MCQFCAPIEKNLAIFFALTRLVLFILSIIGQVNEEELDYKDGHERTNEDSPFFFHIFSFLLSIFLYYGSHVVV